ncbi:MAG: T9SS type A sorting domain-containing protein, partial [Bacteroidales bacterium]|nr:T9SS type A sorting domain-containing protein [Bacteroidales bacterium]
TNIVKINVYAPFNQGSIVGNDTICYNGTANNIVFNQAPSGGNFSYDYQWMESDDNINWTNIPNVSPNHTPTNLTSSKHFRVKVVSNCGVDYTNSQYIHVFPNISKAIIGASDSICYDTMPDMFEVTDVATGADGVFEYYWQISNNGLVWNSINGGTGETYQHATMSHSAYFRICASSTFGCGTVNSDSIYIHVFTPINSGIIGSSQNICYETVAQEINFLNSPNGGGDIYSYQWQVSSDSIVFSNINGAELNTYSPGTLNSTRYYKLVVYSEKACGSDTTNVVKKRVYDPFVVGTIGNNDTICWNDSPNTLLLITNPTGGDETYQYQWVSSANTNNWQSISGANDINLNILNLRESNYYRLVISSGSNCGIDTSNVIYIHVNPLPDTVAINGTSVLCRNQKDVVFNFTPLDNNINYFWYSNNFEIIGGETTNQIVGNAPSYSGVDTIFMEQRNFITSCINVMKYPITISNNMAPDKSAIIRKSNTNILICSDSTTGINYQWGYTQKSDMNEFVISNSNNRYVMLPHGFDTIQYYYWVDTWFVYDNKLSCETRSYFNNPPLSISVDEISNQFFFKTYPNPVSDILYISFSNSMFLLSELIVFDMRGRVVYTLNNFQSGDSIIIDERFENGVYLIKIQNDSFSFDQKIIIIK